MRNMGLFTGLAVENPPKVANSLTVPQGLKALPKT